VYEGNSIYHYTTKVIEVSDGKVKALDGFSLTDYYYISELLPKNYKMIFRTPRHGNSSIIVDSKDGLLIPLMSFDIMFIDRETAEFYIKPNKKILGIKDIDDVLSNAIVIDEDGNTYKANEIKASYFPYLRELAYNKPDLTVTLYTNVNGEIYKDIVDVYGKYYFNVIVANHPFYGKQRHLLFLGYLKDIMNILPPIHVAYRKIDPWRGHSEPKDLDVHREWVRLTDSEWCGAYSQSELALKNLQDALLKLLELNAFEYVCTVISYTSNIFVTYIDFYVKPTSKAYLSLIKPKIDMIISEIQQLEIREIVRNLFQF
jgi:hypothetical protein